MTPFRLEARGIGKTFGRTAVLQGVDLSVRPGEIHALIGQNGSGKSTLVKILTGYHQPDPGMTLAVDGQRLRVPVRWKEIKAAGVSIVHQDLGLLDELSVAENIAIGGFTHSRFLRKINWSEQCERARNVLTNLGVVIDPREKVAGLGAVQRAEVAIARGMREIQMGGGLIILDEATRALPREELVRFHGLLRRIVASGTSVLMVSHNLDEVLKFSDRVTVLRDGRVVLAGCGTTEVDERSLARTMLGRRVQPVAARSYGRRFSKPALEVSGLTTGEVRELSFSVGAGEVVGLTGLPGSGFESVPYVLGGATRAVAGCIRTAARNLDAAKISVVAARQAGLALLPERRARDGLALDMSIRDNIALPQLRSRGRSWWVSQRWQDELARQAVGDFGIVAPSTRTTAHELSGGNQQKVLFAKWSSVAPEALVLHEPTQAVDVGARADILNAIRKASDRGIGVLIVTIEPTDLAEVCDRVLVLAGTELKELRDSTPDRILDAVYSGASGRSGGNSLEVARGVSHV